MNKEKENYPDWLVPLEVGKKLKEIGFDKPCHFYYQNEESFLAFILFHIYFIS